MNIDFLRQSRDGRMTLVLDVRELIRADAKRKAEKELEAKLLEGLNSPESELTQADWKAIRSEALARVQAYGTAWR